MKSISDYRNEIEEGIKHLDFNDGDLTTLYDPIKYALSAGGKRLRPVLLLMGADAFDTDCKNAIKPAIGIEMFHNFTLLHDDVMDKSEMRRGRLTVHKKFDVNSAILSGDTMLTLASQYVSNVDEKILRNVLDVFDNMAIRVYEGQRMDMDFESKPEVSVEKYIKMIEYKTGALLGASVKIGALIGGATEKDAELMNQFGINIGIAFQIQDDWLDTFGDASTFGKPIGGDINNSKKTFLYVKALNEKGQTAQALRSAYEIPPGEVRVKTVTKLYEKLGMSEISKKAVNSYLSKALKSLNNTTLDQSTKEVFHQFAEKLIGRKK